MRFKLNSNQFSIKYDARAIKIKSNRIESNRIKSNQIKSNQIKPKQIKIKIKIKIKIDSSNHIKFNRRAGLSYKSDQKFQAKLCRQCSIASQWGSRAGFCGSQA